jgi:hypothetical protein
VRGYRLLIVAAILAGGACAAWPYKLPHPSDPPEAPPLRQVVDVPLRRADVLIETGGPTSDSPAGEALGQASGPYWEYDAPVEKAAGPQPEQHLAPDLAAHYTPLDGFRPTSWRPAPVAPLPKRSRSRQHRLTDGDSLESLAERYLGDRARAGEIYEVNREVLPAADLLPLGKIIRIPPRERDALTPAE